MIRLDQPHHPQVDDGEDGEAQCGHDRNIDREAAAAGHEEDARRNEPGKGHDGDPMPAVRLTAVDTRCLLRGVGYPFGHRGMQRRRADERGGDQQRGVDRAGQRRLAVEDQEVMGEVGRHHDDQGAGDELVERTAARP